MTANLVLSSFSHLRRGAIIVAHPDDDALFAGPLQIELDWIDWTVVCATYSPDSKRGQEMIAWQGHLGVDKVHFLNFKDDGDDLLRHVSSFGEDDVICRLKEVD